MSDFDLANMDEEEILDRIPLMDKEQGAKAKAFLRSSKQRRWRKLAKAYRDAQLPSNMAEPRKFRIRQWNGESVSGGLHFLSSNVPGYRKLAPGEVICLDLAEEWVRDIVAEDVLELTNDAVTRPIVFESAYIATRSDPSRREVYAQKDPTGLKSSLTKQATEADRINHELMQVQPPTERELPLDMQVQLEANKALAEGLQKVVDGETQVVTPSPEGKTETGAARRGRSK